MKHRALLPFLALILALLCCLPACTAATDSAQDTTDEVTTTPTPAQTEPPLTITENGVSTFTLIRPEEAGSIITSSATALRHKLIERTGAELALASDWYNPREEKPTFDNPEILLGETNRDESTEVLASLPENSYAVVKRNNKLVIIGTDDNLTILALYAFEEQILNNAEKCADGTLTFSEADNLLVTLDAFTLSDMIKSGYAITASSTKVVSSAKQGEYGVGQGACSDGTYAYFALRNSTDTGTVITKYALESNTLVKVSDVLNLGHANDMTYDAKNDRIVVAHGQSEGQILTLVDPDTLEAIEDIHIPKARAPSPTVWKRIAMPSAKAARRCIFSPTNSSCWPAIPVPKTPATRLRAWVRMRITSSSR